MLRRPALFVAPLVLAGLLAGCAGAPAPEPTPTDQFLEQTPGSSGSAPGAGQSAADGGVIVIDGMPVSGLLTGCGELVDESRQETDVDIQWRWEFACATRDAFDASLVALDGEPALTRTQEMVVGDASYVREVHHWIGELGGVVDVDAKLSGSPGDIEVTFLVTLRTDG